MITGFNTDIEYEGVTYHVQTEDKGMSRPIILSLVYDRGTILASKRSPYSDLLHSKFNEKLLAERLSKQHRLICAAIQAGRIEDLKKMSARDNAPPAAPAAPAIVRASAPPLGLRPPEPAIQKPPSQLPGSVVTLPKAVSLPPDDYRQLERPIPKPSFDSEERVDDVGSIDGPLIDAVAIFDEDEAILIPAEAVAIIDEPGLPPRPDHNRLAIEVLGDTKFKGGERVTVGFMVSRGSQRKVVSGAQIMVKILGSSFRPVIFHAQTDVNGVASVNMQLPSFTSGRAAFLVRAIADGEEIELRRSVAHG